MEQLKDQEYGISVGREVGKIMAFFLAMQRQKNAADEAVTGLAADLCLILIVELQMRQRAVQVRQSSFANLETKGRGISHRSDSGYFVEVEGQRWGMESHPVPLQLSRISDGTFWSQQCQLEVSLLLPGHHLCTAAHSQACGEGIM